MSSAADTVTTPNEAGPIEAARRHAAAPGLRLEDMIVLGCVAAAAALAWLWLAGGAAMDHAMPMPAIWSAAYLGPAFAMWALMMVAMMLPSAAPMILLHARVAGHRGRFAWLESLVFALAYVAVWTGFAAAAALAQAGLIGAGLVHEIALSTGDAGLAASLLVAAGVYQFSPAKQACLHQCRSPLSFIFRLWRPGLSGALRLGLRHGAYCLGCCWLLMLLLFVGGVMNLAWIAALAMLLLAEKYAPRAWRLTRIIGIALLAGATALFVAA